jgi:hypothetical protein
MMIMMDRRGGSGTYSNPVDFFIPAIMVEMATKSKASRVSLLRPNMVGVEF